MQIHRCEFVPWVPQGVLHMAYNAGSSRLAVAREDNTVEIWNQNPYFYCSQIIPSVSSAKQALRRLLWLSDTRLIGAGFSGEILEFDLETLEVKDRCSSYGGPVWDMALHKNGKMLAVACEDGSVRLFNTEHSLDYVRSIASDARVLSVAFHPSKFAIASGDSEGRLRYYDVEKNAQAWASTVASNVAIWSVGVMEDSTVVTGDSIGHTQFWDGQFGTLLHSYSGHKAGILAMACVETPNHRCVYTSGNDSRVVKFEPASSGWVPTLDARGHLHDVNVLTVAGSTLISGSVDGSMGLYGMHSFGTKAPKTLFPFPPFHNSAFAVAAEVRMFAVRMAHSVQLYRLGKSHTKNQENSQNGTKLEILKPYQPLVELKPDVALPLTAMALSQNGELVMISSRAGLRAYSLEVSSSGNVAVARLELPEELSRLKVLKMVLSESMLVMATFSGEIIVYNLEAFEFVCKIDKHKKSYISGLVVKDNNLVVCNNQGGVTVYDLASASAIASLSFEMPITSVMFHPDNETQLILSSLSSRIYIYDFLEQKHTTWSTTVGDKLDLSSIPKYNFRSCILGLAAVDSKVIWWTTHNFNVVDTEQAEARINHVDRYKDIVHFSRISATEMLLIQRSWQKILTSLPDPLHRHRYIL